MSQNKKSAAEIEDWIRARLGERLGIPPASLDRNELLLSYGLTSFQLAQLSGDLEDWLGQEVNPSDLLEYPTLAAVSSHLSGAAETHW